MAFTDPRSVPLIDRQHVMEANDVDLDARGGGSTDSGWVLPTLATDITQNDTFWNHLGYRKLNGWVMLVLSLDVANPATGKLLFTLPTGFRITTGPGAADLVGFQIAVGTTLRVRSDGQISTGSTGGQVVAAISYPVAA